MRLIQTVRALAEDGSDILGPDGEALTATFASWSSGAQTLVLWGPESSAGPDAIAVSEHATPGARLWIEHAGYDFDGLVEAVVPLYDGQQLSVRLVERDPDPEPVVEADPPLTPAIDPTEEAS